MSIIVKQLALKILAAVFLFSLAPEVSDAQLKRERSVTSVLAEPAFSATKNIGISTIINPSGGDLHYSILHTFGLVDGGIDRFYGLDDGANTRLGLIYGVTDRFSIGVGRMTFRKVVDISAKVNLMQQTKDAGRPVSIALKGATGISTVSGQGLDFNERLSYFTSVMFARKFNTVGIQLTPMYSYFNRVLGEDEQHLFGLGVLLQVDLNERLNLSWEYLPVLGNRNPGTDDAMALSLNIDTGGHVFQIFFASSQWHNEQYIMANNSDRFWEGDFRFGFNIHRVFGLF
ncbi:MAG: hypothetical protein GVY08_08710 [Bacteroidetes bacterium]|jgi:hypothetical protein|nr:hypothetical protein [Bacteroidota bacterium]